MISISPHLDEISERIKASLFTADQKDSRFVAIYQITLGLQFRDFLQAVKVLAETKQVAGMWVIIRTLSELYIRSSWIGMDENRALHIFFGEKVDERNRLREQKCILKSAGQPVPPELNLMIETLEDELIQQGNTVSKSPEYWDENNNAFKKAPKINLMARPATSSDPATHKKEQERHEIYTAYFKFGSWYIHGSHLILQDYFEKGNTDKIPVINAFAENEPEYEAARSDVLVLAFKFALHLGNLGYQVDKEKIHSIAASAPKIHGDPPQ